MLDLTLVKIESDQLTGFATLGLGVVTLIVAAVAIYQARLTRTAVKAAQDAAQEEMKSRVDQRAPTVVVTCMKPAEPTTEWMTALEPNRTFDPASQSNLSLAIGGWFLMRNEGKTTALVTLPQDSADSDASRDTTSFGAMKHDGIVPSSQPKTIELRPGEMRRFYWEMRRPLSRWIELVGVPEGWDRKNGGAINIADNFKDGIADSILLTVQGCPTVPDNESGGWHSDVNPPRIMASPIFRHYREPINPELIPRGFQLLNKKRGIWDRVRFWKRFSVER